METWQKTSLILCVFGLLKELRPSEPFITAYFIGFKNITAEKVIHDLYPIGTYTILAASLVIFLVTDFFRYRPIIIFQGISYVLCWITLIYGEAYFLMQIVEILYGLAISADVAYYTYIYAHVDKEFYPKVTSYTYAAALAGRFLASSSAQILVSLHFLNFHELVYITLSTATGAFLVSLFLPAVRESIYFNRTDCEERSELNTNTNTGSKPVDSDNNTKSVDEPGFLERLNRATGFLWLDFKDAYTQPYVLKWSIWWAFANAGNTQVLYYAQPLWERVESFRDTKIYNGGVGAIQCLLGALLTFGVGHLKISWRKWGEPFLFVISVLQGIVLIWMSQTRSLYTAYVTYLIFRVLYQALITIASSEVAQGIKKDSCGLIFGINTFLALIIQTVITIVVTDKRGLALDERLQFVVYGGYFIVLGIVFGCMVIYNCCKRGCSLRDRSLTETKGNCDDDPNPI